MLRGSSSVDCNMRRICSGDGVQVVAQVPWAGPVPPPISVVTPDNSVEISVVSKTI
jgi:hypothetical protein